MGPLIHRRVWARTPAKIALKAADEVSTGSGSDWVFSRDPQLMERWNTDLTFRGENLEPSHYASVER